MLHALRLVLDSTEHWGSTMLLQERKESRDMAKLKIKLVPIYCFQRSYWSDCDSLGSTHFWLSRLDNHIVG